MKFLLTLLFALSAYGSDYPASWWQKVPESDRASWEILPQDAKHGEVVLSKRTELGVFSNLSCVSFTFDGEEYASVEALWQMMKYPDPLDPTDPRREITYPNTREEVKKMCMFQAKEAGDRANLIMKRSGIKVISYRGKRFDYKDMGNGSEYHYGLIKEAIKSKVIENANIKKLLLKTDGLVLIPDHKIDPNSPKAYFYNKILMELRDSIK